MRAAWLLPLLVACKAPPSIGEVRTVDPARSEVYGAGLLFASTNAAADVHDAALVDGEGRERWRWAGEGEVLRIRRLGDDTVLLALDSTSEQTGTVQSETLDGEVIHQMSAPEVHHDVLELPDGRWAWLEHSNRQAPLDGVTKPVSTDVVMVAKPGGNPAPLFSMFDDYPTDPWWVCSHVKKGARIPGYHQWTHSNSLVLSADGRTLWMLARNLDALVGIDVATGAMVDQVGGRDATVPLDGEASLDHPHMSQLSDDGHFLVFDNRVHSKEPTRAVELAVGDDGAEVVWSYAHPQGNTIGYLGDVRRLPGGNTLIVWSAEGVFTEVTPGGEVVWELVLDDTKHIGRTELWEGKLP